MCLVPTLPVSPLTLDSPAASSKDEPPKVTTKLTPLLTRPRTSDTARPRPRDQVAHLPQRCSRCYHRRRPLPSPGKPLWPLKQCIVAGGRSRATLAVSVHYSRRRTAPGGPHSTRWSTDRGAVSATWGAFKHKTLVVSCTETLLVRCSIKRTCGTHCSASAQSSLLPLLQGKVTLSPPPPLIHPCAVNAAL